jgi:hypothetical protein
VDEIPVGGNWQYEPKWDGFRCIAFRDRGEFLSADVSGTAQDFCGGVPTNHPANAPWIKFPVAKANRWRCCSTASMALSHYRDQLGSVIRPRPSRILVFLLVTVSSK